MTFTAVRVTAYLTRNGIIPISFSVIIKYGSKNPGTEPEVIHGKVNPKLGIYRWVSGFGQGDRFLVKK